MKILKQVPQTTEWNEVSKKEVLDSVDTPEKTLIKMLKNGEIVFSDNGNFKKYIDIKVVEVKKRITHCPDCLRFLDWNGKKTVDCRDGETQYVVK